MDLLSFIGLITILIIGIWWFGPRILAEMNRTLVVLLTGYILWKEKPELFQIPAGINWEWASVVILFISLFTAVIWDIRSLGGLKLKLKKKSLEKPTL